MANTPLGHTSNAIQPGHYQSACHLNRILMVSAAVLTGLSLVQHTPKLPTQWIPFGYAITGLLLVLTFVLNEMIYQTSKRLKETPLQRLNPYIYMLFYCFGAFLMTCVFMTHAPGIPLFIGALALQAQHFKRPYIAAQLYLLTLLVYTLDNPVYNNPIGFSQTVILIGTTATVGYFLGQLLQTQTHQVEVLQSMATTDALTRLVNRRQFNARLNSEVSRARRHHSALSLALFDIDNFKYLNDHYGHPVGDRILKELGQLIFNNVRESDVAARYGGEEFALILPETREKEASELLERLRQLIAETVFCLPDNPITLTVSIGVAELNARYNNVFELVERTDQALYQAKGQGKNRVYNASQGIFPLPLTHS